MSVEGDTGPYLQYSCARTGSILRKAEARGKTLDPTTLDEAARIGALLREPEERGLILRIDELPVVVAQAARTLRPSVMCTYLLALAKSINRFCNSKQCHVLSSEGDLLQARLMLVTAAREAMTWALARLGIEAPPRM